MPERGRKRVRVADEDAIGDSRCGVFTAILLGRDFDKFLRSPNRFAAVQFGDAVFATVFLNPVGLEMLRQ